MTRFGPLREGPEVRFRLWAPDAAKVWLLRPDAPAVAMTRGADGFHSVSLPAAEGQLYRFRIGELEVPDPASRAQAEDVEGWSRLVGPVPPPRSCAIRPWAEAIIAEVHVGTATPQGSFDALRAALPDYVAAGYTALELMPVADFPGRWNWGYDGVLPFAPDTRYGTPEGLRALVDAAHASGLAMLLDVVYNHFGPSGNFLSQYAGAFFSTAERTPWGPAIDLANPTVRAFFVENAVMWLRDYDFDGLRLDAVHAFIPGGGDALLAEIATACRAVKPDAWLVLENDDNAARWLSRTSLPAYTAQWNDDFHHALHVIATGQRSGYYGDYADDPVGALARCLTEGFAFQGEASSHRGGASRGEASAHLPPGAFVAFVQNHDQIGNRPFGDRLAAALAPERIAVLQFVVMLSPQIPLFFMGEEVGATTPFPFFCDFGGDLAEAVREGRAREFAGFFADHAGGPDDLPDPLAKTTVERARLRPGPDAAARRARFAALAQLRRRLVWPLTIAGDTPATELVRDGDALRIEWHFAVGTLTLAVNFGAQPACLTLPTAPPDAIEGALLAPWSAALWSRPA